MSKGQACGIEKTQQVTGVVGTPITWTLGTIAYLFGAASLPLSQHQETSEQPGFDRACELDDRALARGGDSGPGSGAGLGSTRPSQGKSVGL